MLSLQGDLSLLQAPGILFLFFPVGSLPLTFSALCLSSLLSLCLLLNSGLQGDILTVIRRVDEHWIEAKLGEKIGICPLQFTEVSSS